MCFSATASFTASTLLLICSFFTLSKAKKSQRMLAAIPLLFAIQQFLEGMTWRQLTDNQDATPYAYGYIIFAFLIWPLWIPIAIRAMSSLKKERSNLRLPIMAGAIVLLFALSYLGSAELSTTIAGNHIYYSAPIDQSIITITTICYLFATITPFFMVTTPYAPAMGTILAIAYLISYFFYSCHIISIWCFFAAILSLLTFLMVG